MSQTISLCNVTPLNQYDPARPPRGFEPGKQAKECPCNDCPTRAHCLVGCDTFRAYVGN
jgi:hypothetical protein